MYVAETIQTLDEQKQLFISRVSQKISQAKQLIKMHNNYQFEPLENGYRGVWVDSDYASVKQRWLLLHSEQAEKRTHHTLNKTLLKSSTASYKDFKNCASDALVVSKMPKSRSKNGSNLKTMSGSVTKK